MEGMNFQQMIQQAVERNGGDVKAAENFDNVTRLDRFTTDLTLKDGVVTLNDMQGQSPVLALSRGRHVESGRSNLRHPV